MCKVHKASVALWISPLCVAVVSNLLLWTCGGFINLKSGRDAFYLKKTFPSPSAPPPTAPGLRWSMWPSLIHWRCIEVTNTYVCPETIMGCPCESCTMHVSTTSVLLYIFSPVWRTFFFFAYRFGELCSLYSACLNLWETDIVFLCVSAQPGLEEHWDDQ
jgi:hypothetical protein